MSNRILLRTLVICAVALSCAVSASADVTIKQKTTTKMMGGMVTMSGKSNVYISGDKQKTDQEMKTKMMMGKAPTTNTSYVMRLDKDLVWNIDHDRKAYTELTFAQMKAMTASAPQMGQMGGESGPPDAGDLEMGKPVVTVDRTGNEEKIKGYQCKEVILQMTVHCKNKKTGDTGSYVVHDRMWLASDCPGREEYRAFGQKAAKKMGYGMGGGSAFAGFGIDPEAMWEKMSELDGFPMRQKISMVITGEIMQQGGPSGAEQQEAMKQASKMMKGIFGGKKDKESDESGPGSDAMVEMTIEVESVSTKGIDGGAFEIPEGYKKTAETK